MAKRAIQTGVIEGLAEIANHHGLRRLVGDFEAFEVGGGVVR